MSGTKVSQTPAVLNPQLLADLKEIASKLLPSAEMEFASDEEFGATHATEVYFARDEDPSPFIRKMREAGFWVSGIQIVGPTHDQAAALGEVLEDLGFWLSPTVNGTSTVRRKSDGPSPELVEDIVELRLWAERRAAKRRAAELREEMEG